MNEFHKKILVLLATFNFTLLNILAETVKVSGVENAKISNVVLQDFKRVGQSRDLLLQKISADGYFFYSKGELSPSFLNDLNSASLVRYSLISKDSNLTEIGVVPSSYDRFRLLSEPNVVEGKANNYSEKEPNNSFFLANLINKKSSLTGQLVSRQDQDYFFISIPDPNKLTLKVIKNSKTSFNPEVFIFDEDFNQLAKVDFDDKGEIKITDFSDKFYLRLSDKYASKIQDTGKVLPFEYKIKLE